MKIWKFMRLINLVDEENSSFAYNHSSIFVEIILRIKFWIYQINIKKCVFKITWGKILASAKVWKILIVGVQFYSGYFVYFHFWASDPFVTSFEFGFRTCSFYFVESLNHYVLVFLFRVYSSYLIVTCV